MYRSLFQFQRCQIVAQYGRPGCDGEGPYPAQLHIFKEDVDLSNSIHAPNFSLDLETAQVTLVRGSPLSDRKSETGPSCRSLEVNCSFCVSTRDGMSYQFRTEDGYECQLWINVLKFLIIFPHTSVPRDPSCDISALDRRLNPLPYQAGMYIHVYVCACTMAYELHGSCAS